ncbi:MAG: hypothetical protein A2286_06050 [Gammaproteobacteria bacterium RIFOXYA12_FULL_61_12]|nr:MAG: hypothetical protein A2514_15950 [Gammaproteobacteria bacterium RIFOXYD12_FULL_61_37]OGT94577.1 MAG: hypothetical protein A2286_06050 [Gammaproteobacteria bacterium RIFOXYA12_FULL_61_12]
MMNTTTSKRNSGGSTRPVIQRKITLSSYQAQQTFRRSFDPTARSFYLLSIVLRAIAHDDQAREVEAMVDVQLDEMQERLTAEALRLERMCEDSGIDPTPTFTRPQEIDAEISTPRINRYLGLINQLDRVVGLISLLWLSGVRSDSQYSAECYLWQRNLLRLSNRIREIANRAVSAANRVKSGQDGEPVEGQETEHDITPVPIDPEGHDDELASGAEPAAGKRGRKKKAPAAPAADEAVADEVADETAPGEAEAESIADAA